MKKFLILLIIPLLFFSTGCDDNDDDNNDIIPVSEYPESILGHWKYDQIQSRQRVYYIDPIYGIEVVTIDTTYVVEYPILTNYYEEYYDVYLTYKYDGTMESNTFYFDIDTDTLVNHYNNSNDYNINENIIYYTSGNDLSEEIIQLTDESLEIYTDYEPFDVTTPNDVDDKFLHRIDIRYMSRVNELPPIP